MRTRRARIGIILSLTIGLVFITVSVVSTLTTSTMAPGPTYTVAQVMVGWRRHPANWIGHPLNLRGIIVSSTRWPPSTIPGQGLGQMPIAAPVSGGVVTQFPAGEVAVVALVDDRQFSMPRLSLRVQTHASRRATLRAALHGIPLIGRFMPSALYVGTEATYQIQLNPPRSCGRFARATQCYDGIILVS